MDVQREEWAVPGGRGVVSGLNSILYQTHLYLHKQEACLLGRESTAIHFLSGRLANATKTWTAADLGGVVFKKKLHVVINTCCGFLEAYSRFSAALQRTF